MKCTNGNCDKRKYCERAHAESNFEFGQDSDVLVPNELFLELNYSNRFVKRGIPAGGFKFGCFKIAENQHRQYEVFLNNENMGYFEFGQLVDICNDIFSNMVASGKIKIK